MGNFRQWLKQGTVIGAGPLRFKITGAFWLMVSAVIFLMLCISQWTWAIVFAVIAAVVGIAVTRARRS